MQTDKELREIYGPDYSKIYNKEYQKTVRKGKHRYSGKEYINPYEKIALLKEKYKNGVSTSQIMEMLG